MGLVAVASGQLVVICLGESRLWYIVIWPSDNQQRLTVRGVLGSELHGRKKALLSCQREEPAAGLTSRLRGLPDNLRSTLLSF